MEIDNEPAGPSELASPIQMVMLTMHYKEYLEYLGKSSIRCKVIHTLFTSLMHFFTVSYTRSNALTPKRVSNRTTIAAMRPTHLFAFSSDIYAEMNYKQEQEKRMTADAMQPTPTEEISERKRALRELPVQAFSNLVYDVCRELRGRWPSLV